MPYGLDNIGGDSHKENTSLGSKSDPHTLLPPQDYRSAPPPEYHAASLPPITTYAYGSVAEPINGSPQWFDFPHLTRHPVPAALPVWVQNRDHTWCPHLQTDTSPLRSSHNYDDPTVHLSLEARKASISSLDSGIIMPPNSMRGPDMRVPRSDRSTLCPQFESVPLNNYAQHSGNSHMRTDVAHYQYASTSEPRSVCFSLKVLLLMSYFIDTGGLSGSKRTVLALQPSVLYHVLATPRGVSTHRDTLFRILDSIEIKG